MPLQAKIHKSLRRFNVVVLHRGCGKSILAINELIRRAFTCEDESGAQFIYVAPEKQQAKNIIWGKLKHYTKNIPNLRIREDELSITFPDNKAVICLEGADNPDRLRGRHPHFVVMDEVGQMKRDVWYEVVMPGTMAQKAPVLFIGTPKGDNLFKELYDLGKERVEANDDDWFVCNYNIYNSGRYNPDEVQQIKNTMPDSKFNQEYLCSFDAAFSGAYYAPMLDDGSNRAGGRVFYDPMRPVITGWDLGTADPTVIWFAQQMENGNLNVIDYYENNNKDFMHFVNVVKNKGYSYSYHVLPHDGNNRSWDSGKSRKDIARSHGLKIVTAPKTNPLEGIAVAQTKLYTTVFDSVRCKQGIRHLQQYCSKKDQITGQDTGEPAANGSQHAADAFRTLIMGMKSNRGSHFEGMSEFGKMMGWERKNKEVVWDYDYFG